MTMRCDECDQAATQFVRRTPLDNSGDLDENVLCDECVEVARDDGSLVSAQPLDAGATR